MALSVSCEHMGYEDALTILSYASPYDVQLTVQKSTDHSTLTLSKRNSTEPAAPKLQHPFYRSQSIDDLTKVSTCQNLIFQDFRQDLNLILGGI